MRVAITTLGCKVNQYDSSVIRERLEAEHHSMVPFEKEADVYIINSCTVTDRADSEARQLVRKARRSNARARVLVTGCYAQVNPREVLQLPGVDFVVGLNRLDELVRFVRASEGDNPPLPVEIGREKGGVAILGAGCLPDHTRAFLKIQEGCDYSCTYCIIPIARGRSRSLSPEEVVQKIRLLSKRGFREIVLTGIHLGGYGRDVRPKTDLVSLLERIVESRLVPRVRLSSLDPRELTDRLLRFMARSDLLCPHLHVCVQAGEDGVLRRMRRNYGTADYQERMLSAREVLPEASLGTDIIAGFPGESDADFERSMEFFASLPLTYFHVFPYSVRRGTVAAGLSGQVSPEVRKDRARRLRDLGARKRRAFHRGFIGSQVSVLVEREEAGICRGYSKNYLPVRFPGSPDLVNREVDVTLHGFEDGKLWGSCG